MLRVPHQADLKRWHSHRPGDRHRGRADNDAGRADAELSLEVKAPTIRSALGRMAAVVGPARAHLPEGQAADDGYRSEAVGAGCCSITECPVVCPQQKARLVVVSAQVRNPLLAETRSKPSPPETGLG
jgi:hypothetical protein